MEGRRFCLSLAICLGLMSCTNGVEVSFYSADDYPEKLSQWGLLQVTEQRLRIPDESHVYELNTALFSDYALKLRTLYIPAGESARYQPDDAFQLPTGSIIAKTFLYRTSVDGAIVLDATWDGDPQHLDLNTTQLIETRLLVKQTDGWDAMAYIWQGDDANLNITGELMTLATTTGATINYLVPSRNQCASCHATDHTSGDIKPIGIKARHLHRPDPVRHQNQLRAWQQRGQLKELPDLDTIQAAARWQDTAIDLAHRARTYLDINCGHCHNSKGAADTSGLLLDYPLDASAAHSPAALGVCKPPIAAGRGSGGHLYSIVPGSAMTSIMAFRLNTTDPATMMPELGRSLVHTEGHVLVSAWIDAMSGVCR